MIVVTGVVQRGQPGTFEPGGILERCHRPGHVGCGLDRPAARVSRVSQVGRGAKRPLPAVSRLGRVDADGRERLLAGEIPVEAAIAGPARQNDDIRDEPAQAQRDPGVIQCGATADQQLPAVGVDGTQEPRGIREQIQAPVPDQPVPRLRVMDRWRVRGRCDNCFDLFAKRCQGGRSHGLHPFPSLPDPVTLSPCLFPVRLRFLLILRRRPGHGPRAVRPSGASAPEAAGRPVDVSRTSWVGQIFIRCLCVAV